MRRVFTYVILAVLAPALVGCRTAPSSGSSSTLQERSSAAPVHTTSAPSVEAPVEAAPATPSPHDDRPVIVCFGDSLTAGYGAEDGASYPDFLQQDLDRDGFHYRVVNEGVSGNTTKDGVDRVASVVALHPAVVVLEFGGNDGLRGFKVQTTRANLSTMISTLKASGARVVLAGITLPPDYGPDYVTAFTATYPMLAHKYDLPALPFLLRNVYGVTGLMQADNVHATARGNAIVARNVLPLVEPLLRK